MEPIWYALNVGRGDSFIIEVPRLDQHPYIILIDGGDCNVDKCRTSLQFILDKGWERIDLLVLTHLHPDHLYGLLNVASQIPIIEALLPYPELFVQLGELEDPKAVQSAELLEGYRTLQQLLMKQQSVITLRYPFGERTKWTFGEYELQQIAPVAISEMAAYQTLRSLAHISPEGHDALLAAFDGQSNEDSTVMLLSHRDGEQLLLLAGDAILTNWELILKREKLNPRVFKVGHHGLLDAWNTMLLNDLKPDWVLITNNDHEYELYRDEWEQLAQSAGSGLSVTGAKKETRYLASRLPQRPERME